MYSSDNNREICGLFDELENMLWLLEILRAYPQINKSDIIVPKAGDNNDREEKLSIMDHIR